MIVTRSLAVRAALVVLLTVAAVPLVAAKKVPTEPGKYKVWGPDIDEIEIVKPFRTADYSKVVVERLDVSATPAPEDADLSDKVRKVLEIATEPFAEGVEENRKSFEVLTERPADLTRTLIVRTKVITMDPGSRSKRIFIGYGAGAARGAITAEIVDAQSGEVLVRLTQERRSGVERFGRGSSYEEIMKRNLRALGEDVANVLNAF